MATPVFKIVNEDKIIIEALTVFLSQDLTEYHNDKADSS